MEKPLNILQVVPYFYPSWTCGGTPRVVYELSRRLAAMGHNITVYTTDVYDAAARVTEDMVGSTESSPQHFTADIEGMRVVYFRNISPSLAFKGRIFMGGDLPDFLKQEQDHFDLAHLHEFRTLMNIPFIKANIPFALSAHGGFTYIMGKKTLKKAYDIFAGNRLLDAASALVAVSPLEAAQYREYGIPPEKIFLSANGISPDDFKDLPEKGEFRRRYGLEDKRIVMFLGRMNPIKGPDLLIEAFGRAAYPDAALVMVGPEDGALEHSKKLAEKLGIVDRVIFTGMVSPVERLSALVDADLMVLPSRHEIFGLSLLESLMCGTPVIVSKNVGIAPVLEEAGAAVIVDCDDIDDLSYNIAEYLSRSEKRRKMVKAGRNLIAEKYNWEKITDDLVELYRTISGKRKEQTE